MPYSFLEHRLAQENMPKLTKIAKESGITRMNSVYPVVSSVAWTTYSTGENPGGHNIFGFVDRVAKPFGIKIPTAKDRKARTIWSRLSRQGKRVIIINVPMTYPPERVNGILVSGFLCPDIEKSSYPVQFCNYLKSQDYTIDVDAWLAQNNQKKKFMEQLHRAMEKRFTLTFKLFEREEWDFFQLHIMETDRLFHFFWNEIDNGQDFNEDIKSFFEKLDDFVGDLRERLSDKDRFLILSDHGFCGIKSEVQLNLWLQNQGLLKFKENAEKKLSSYDRESLCYSLIPGRIFINLKGREEKGSVNKNDYERVRKEIKERLLDFKDPRSGERIIERVFFREEIYEGPYLEAAADIIVHPAAGFDLKGRVDTDDIFNSSALNGMHTYNDAFILGVNFDLNSVSSIQDVKNIIINKDD